MPHLTFADLVSRRVPVSASEAAALTLAVAHVMDSQRAAGQRVRLPDDEWILLSSSGEVSLVEVHRAAEVDETAALSALLRRLLQLDHRENGRATRIPGGLLIVLARNLGYIHLPATSPRAFRAALERFATSDTAVLASVFWRAASGRPELVAPRTPVLTRRVPIERRQRGLSRTELRRAVQELEREIFELRGAQRALRRNPRRLSLSLLHYKRLPPQLFTSGAAVMFICLLAAAAVAVTRTGPGADPAAPHDVVLHTSPAWTAPGPSEDTEDLVESPRIVRANRVIGESTVESRLGRRPPAASPRTRSTDRNRIIRGDLMADPEPEPKRPRPATGMPGGTRGIPFALP